MGHAANEPSHLKVAKRCAKAWGFISFVTTGSQMSAQDHITATRRTGSHIRKFVLPTVVALLLLAMALDTKVVAIGSKQDMRSDTFSAQAYGEKEFTRIQSEIEKSAVDAKLLSAAIVKDAVSAGEQYGKPGSVGPIFPIRFSGVVGEGSSGIFAVTGGDLPKGISIRVQTGPAINGTEVRDATGTVSFGQFTNQIEYQDAGSALNNEVKAHVLAGLDRNKLSGKTVEVVGVFELINPTGWLVTPVRLTVTP